MSGQTRNGSQGGLVEMSMSREERFWMTMLAGLVCLTIGITGTMDRAKISRTEDRDMETVNVIAVPARVHDFTGDEQVMEALACMNLKNMNVCPTEKEHIGTEDDMEDPLEAEKIEAALVEQGYFREDVPLSFFLQDILHTACEREGVDYAVALGLIDVESDFNTEAVNPVSGCYGLCQLNPTYFPAGLTPAENIDTGIAYLAEQLHRYNGDMEAALTAYNAGYDTGRREYVEKVLAAAERWE